MKIAALTLGALYFLNITPARADSITILSVTGTEGSSGPVGGSQSNAAESQYLGISFVLGSAFQDVAITVPDMRFNNWIGTAWLTNAIGPGANSSNVIATATVDPFPGGGFGATTTTFLSDVDLSPGTYFFFLSSPLCSDNSIGCGMGLWPSIPNGSISALPGTALIGEEIVGGFLIGECINPNCPVADFDFPPASPWTFNTFPNVDPLAIEITGNTVPEPSGLILFSTGLVALCGLRTRSRYQRLGRTGAALLPNASK